MRCSKSQISIAQFGFSKWCQKNLDLRCGFHPAPVESRCEVKVVVTSQIQYKKGLTTVSFMIDVAGTHDVHD